MSLSETTDFIRANSSDASVYEQLAEEATELAQACLKKARVIRGESPTRVDSKSATTMIFEEYTDVSVVAHVLGLRVDSEAFSRKLERWADRIDEFKLNNQGRHGKI